MFDIQAFREVSKVKVYSVYYKNIYISRMYLRHLIIKRSDVFPPDVTKSRYRFRSLCIFKEMLEWCDHLITTASWQDIMVRLPIADWKEARKK